MFRPNPRDSRFTHPVTDFHAFKQREKGDAGGLTKRTQTTNSPDAFTVAPDETANRGCRSC